MEKLLFDDGFQVFLDHLTDKSRSPNTIRAYTRDIHQIGDVLGPIMGVSSREDIDLAAVTSDDLALAFREHAATRARSTGRRADTSRARTMACWSKFFSELVRKKKLPSSPMDGVDAPTTRQRKPKPLTHGEALDRILEASLNPPKRQWTAWPQRDFVLMLLLGGAGLRSGETRSLHVKDLVNFSDGLTMRVLGKGQKVRMVPLPNSIAEQIALYLEQWPAVVGRSPKPEDALFVSRSGEPMTAAQMEHRFRRIVAAAGMQGALDPGTQLHALRHTFATRAIQDGMPLARLQTLMGHDAIATTRLYVDVSDAELRAEMEASRSAHLTDFLHE